MKKFNSIEEASASFRKDLIKKATKYELEFKELLRSMRVKFEFQKIMYYRKDGRLKFYIVDFYLPKYNLVIEIDGRHHKDSKEEDKERTRDLKREGVRKVLRFWNKEVYKRKYCKNITKTCMYG